MIRTAETGEEASTTIQRSVSTAEFRRKFRRKPAEADHQKPGRKLNRKGERGFRLTLQRSSNLAELRACGAQCEASPPNQPIQRVGLMSSGRIQGEGKWQAALSESLLDRGHASPSENSQNSQLREFRLLIEESRPLREGTRL